MSNGTLTAPGPYCELHAHSCFSLLDGVPFPEALAEGAAACGLPAIALTDHDALYGAVPFFARAQALGVLPILGAKCLPCHAPANEERLLVDRKVGTYDYTAEFDLVEYDSLIDEATDLPRHGISGRPLINIEKPEDSLLLAKMLGPETSHGGGTIAVNKNDRDYQTLLRWIQEGAMGPAHVD